MSFEVIGDYCEWICDKCGRKHKYITKPTRDKCMGSCSFSMEHGFVSDKIIRCKTLECDCGRKVDIIADVVIELSFDNFEYDENRDKLERIRKILRE